MDMRYLQTVDDDLTERLLLMDDPVGNADRISVLNAKVCMAFLVYSIQCNFLYLVDLITFYSGSKRYDCFRRIKG